MSTRYEPFIVHVGDPAGGIYPVRTDFRGSTAAGSIDAQTPLLQPDELQQALSWLERGYVDHSYARDLGGRFFETLFAGAVGEAFRRAYASVAPEGGLRVVLRLPRELAPLPWELMYDGAGEHGFLARSKTAPLARHFDGLPIPNRPPERGPLRILVVTASPPDYPPISHARESGQIAGALEGRKPGNWLRMLRYRLRPQGDTREPPGLKQVLHVDVLEHATRASLQGALDGERPYHVIHFAGHGLLRGGEAYLLLEGEPEAGAPQRTGEEVRARDFAEMVAGPALNLVVLNACKTAEAPALFESVAEVVLKRGVPAVIGMQTAVLDTAALAFAREFYHAWAAGEELEGALASARRLMSEGVSAGSADWSLPVLHLGPTQGLRLTMEFPPIQLPWPIRWARALALGFIGLLTAVGVLINIPELGKQIRSQVPLIRCYTPASMKGEFKVLMTPFGEQNASGRVTRSREGRELAESLFGRFESQFHELDIAMESALRGPAETCTVQGDSEEERYNNAQKLLERNGATIIIYGYLSGAGDARRLHPKFLVSYEGADQAPELTGAYTGGGAELEGSFDFGGAERAELAAFQSAIEPPVYVRTRALALITVGLSYYVGDDYDHALEFFDRAASLMMERNLGGSDVAHLLIGNAYARRFGTTYDSNDVNSALESYETALGIATKLGNDQSRAQVGKAGALYLQSMIHAGTQPCMVDLTLLAQAEEGFKAVGGAAASTPASAHITYKVNFGLAQINLLRHECTQDPVLLEEAASLLEPIIQAREGGLAGIDELAGHAYARMGRIAFRRPTPEPEEAIENYLYAADLVSYYSEMRYRISAADIYSITRQYGKAVETYTEAISKTASYVPASILDEARTKKQEAQTHLKLE